MSNDPVDYLLVLITGFIAWHGISHRNADGDNDIGHLLFGSIALLFCVRFLFVDVFGLL
jgi:hypothetical protein